MKGRHALHIILLMLWSFFCISPAVPAHFAAAAILETAMGGPAEDADLPQTPIHEDKQPAPPFDAAAQGENQGISAPHAAQEIAAQRGLAGETENAPRSADAAEPSQLAASITEKAAALPKADTPPLQNANQPAPLSADATGQTATAETAALTPPAERAQAADSPDTAGPRTLTVAENTTRGADKSATAQDKGQGGAQSQQAGNADGDAQPDKADGTQQAQDAPDSAQDAILPDDDAGKSVADGVEGHAQPHKDTAAAEAAPAAPTTSTAGGSADGTNGKTLKLFGTVEFRGKLKSVPRWLDALKRNDAAPLFADENVKLSAKQTWKSFKASLLKLKPLDQLKAVNTFWNQWPYRTDPEVYGKPDYWASPREFRTKSGDCEDYCIVKYFTLKELGWRPEQMRIVVVMETIRRIGHAVLAVYLDGKIYILDILSKNVLEHTVFRNYIPQFSVNEQYKWMHMQPNKK